MKDLEYINSKGLGVLISFFKWVKKVGGLVKIAEVPLNIMQVLNLLGLDGLALIYDSSSDAKESFRRQQVKEARPEEYEPSERMDTVMGPPSYKGNKMPFILLGAGFLEQPVHLLGQRPWAMLSLILFEGWRYFPFDFLFIMALYIISSGLIVYREIMVDKEKAIGNERFLKNQMES